MPVNSTFSSTTEHRNNWAILVDTSPYWLNFRHIANVLSVYKLVKSLGIPDDQIILMLADDMACNGRNPLQASVFNHYDHKDNVYGEDIEVDYRGSEITVETFIRLLTNRLPQGTPKSKRLDTDDGSNILIYMTGHGGDNFLKFLDAYEIHAHDLKDAFEQMAIKGRYHEIMFIVDTCQASTLSEEIVSPNIVSLSSCARKESSYSYHIDDVLGVAVADRFTFKMLEYIQKLDKHSNVSIDGLFQSFDRGFLGGHPQLKMDLFNRKALFTKIMDFFSNRQPVILNIEPINISPWNGKFSNHLPSRLKRPIFNIDIDDIEEEMKYSYHRLDGNNCKGLFKFIDLNRIFMSILIISTSLFYILKWSNRTRS